MRTYCKIFNSLKCVKIVLWHRIWSISVNIPCILEKKGTCVLILLDGIFYRCHLDPFGGWWYSVLSFTYILSTCFITERAVLKSQIIIMCVHFFLQFHQLLLHLFEGLLLHAYTGLNVLGELTFYHCCDIYFF